jgi:hypothetical protein
MSKLLATTLLFSISLAGAACGDKKEGGDTAGKTDKAADDVVIDCPAFSKKAAECTDAFIDAYSKTTQGAKAGTGTDGTVDHAKAAKTLKMVWGMEGAKVCAEDTGLSMAFAKYDKRWKERFVKCDNGASCEEWSSCVATAMGEPLQ